MNVLLALFIATAVSFAARADESAAPARIEMHKVVDRLMPSNAVNVVTLNAPRAIPLRELGLEALREGVAIMVADEIRIFTSGDALNVRPAARIWRNAREGGRWWYQTGGVGSAEGHVIEAGQAVIVITRASTAKIPWSNPLAD
jgi:hypothetical protein